VSGPSGNPGEAGVQGAFRSYFISTNNSVVDEVYTPGSITSDPTGELMTETRASDYSGTVSRIRISGPHLPQSVVITSGSNTLYSASDPVRVSGQDIVLDPIAVESPQVTVTYAHVVSPDVTLMNLAEKRVIEDTADQVSFLFDSGDLDILGSTSVPVHNGAAVPVHNVLVRIEGDAAQVSYVFVYIDGSTALTLDGSVVNLSPGFVADVTPHMTNTFYVEDSAWLDSDLYPGDHNFNPELYGKQNRLPKSGSQIRVRAAGTVSQTGSQVQVFVTVVASGNERTTIENEFKVELLPKATQGFRVLGADQPVLYRGVTYTLDARRNGTDRVSEDVGLVLEDAPGLHIEPFGGPHAGSLPGRFLPHWVHREGARWGVELQGGVS
jgi:hypothetical protein